MLYWEPRAGRYHLTFEMPDHTVFFACIKEVIRDIHRMFKSPDVRIRALRTKIDPDAAQDKNADPDPKLKMYRFTYCFWY